MSNSQIWRTQLTDVLSSTTQLTHLTARIDPLGSIRVEPDGKTYKFVELKNTTATVAAAAGSLVAYGAANGYGSNRVVVDLTDADAIVLCAGATLATITGTAGTYYYCWIQIGGQITLDTAVGSGAIGKCFYLTTTDKTAAVGAAHYDQQAGLCVSATTNVILTCPR